MLRNQFSYIASPIKSSNLLRNRRILIGSILPLSALFCLIWPARVACAGKGEDIIRRVQSKFESLSTLSAHFEVRYQSEGIEEVRQEEGTLFMDGQGRFRTETPGQVVVSDGQTVWMYNKQENQVIIRSARSAAEDLLTPQKLLYEYPAKYRIEKVEEVEYAGRLCDLLVMAPKEETDPTRQLQVWVDRRESITRKVWIEDLAGNVTTFEFEAFQFGLDLPPDTFQFIPPEEAEVIDIR